MLTSAVARLGLVALMKAVPASAAARSDTSTHSARVRPLVNAPLPKAPTTMVVRGGAAARGTRLRIDPRREKFYGTGIYEVGVQETFARLLETGDSARRE